MSGSKKFLIYLVGESMVSPQTKEILLAIVEATIYCGAVAAIGGVCLRLFIGQRRWEALYNRLGVVGQAWLGFVIGQGVTSIVWLSLSLAGGFQRWVVWVF